MSITFIDRLADNPDALRYVTGSFQFGQATGAFPRDRLAPNGEECCVLARTKWGTPVGFVTFYDVGNGKAWIDLVWVEADHRRLGLGKKMLAVARREATARGIVRLELGTGLDNPAMRGLAGALGFADRYILMSLPLREGAQ